MTFQALIVLTVLLAAELTHQVSILPNNRPRAQWVEEPASEEVSTHKFAPKNGLKGLPEGNVPQLSLNVQQYLRDINQYLDRGDEDSAQQQVVSNLILCHDLACETRVVFPIQHQNMGADAAADGPVPIDFQKKAYEINRRFSNSDLYLKTSATLIADAKPTVAPVPEKPEVEKEPKPTKGVMHSIVSRFKKLLNYKKSVGFNKKLQ